MHTNISACCVCLPERRRCTKRLCWCAKKAEWVENLCSRKCIRDFSCRYNLARCDRRNVLVNISLTRLHVAICMFWFQKDGVNSPRESWRRMRLHYRSAYYTTAYEIALSQRSLHVRVCHVFKNLRGWIHPVSPDQKKRRFGTVIACTVLWK